jgi:maltose-binding protein MalE
MALIGGCAPRSSEGAGGTELVLWHAYRGAERDALEAAVHAYEARTPGVSVRLVAIPYDAFPDKLSVAVPRGHGPDMFIFAHDRLGAWAEAGLLEPIGFWADEPLIDRFHLETVMPLTFGGELYGLPLAFKTLALYYDTSLVDHPPASTDELVEVAKRLHATRPDVWGIAWDLKSLYFHAPWLHGFGGKVFQSDDGDALALDSPAAAASAAFVHRLLAQDHIIPEEATSALITTLFTQHKLAYVVNGPWFRGELEGDRSWAVAPLPVVSETGRPAAPFLGTEGVFLSARSQHKKEAFELMGYLTSDEVARDRFAKGGQLVANRAIYDDPAVAADPFARAFRAQLAHTVSLSNRPAMRRVWSPMETALSNAIVHGEDPTQALGEAVARIRREGE